MNYVVLLEREFWLLYDGVKSMGKTENELTVNEIFYLIGSTGLNDEKVIGYVFGRYNVIWDD